MSKLFVSKYSMQLHTLLAKLGDNLPTMMPLKKKKNKNREKETKTAFSLDLAAREPQKNQRNELRL